MFYSCLLFHRKLHVTRQLTCQVQSMEQVAAMKAALEGAVEMFCESESLEMNVRTLESESIQKGNTLRIIKLSLISITQWPVKHSEWPEEDTGFEQMLGSGDHDRFPHMGLLVDTSMLLRCEWIFKSLNSRHGKLGSCCGGTIMVNHFETCVKYDWVEVWISLYIIQHHQDFWKKFGNMFGSRCFGGPIS